MVQPDPRLQTTMPRRAAIPLLKVHLQNRHRQNKMTGIDVLGVADDVADLVQKVAERDQQ